MLDPKVEEEKRAKREAHVALLQKQLDGLEDSWEEKSLLLMRECGMLNGRLGQPRSCPERN